MEHRHPHFRARIATAACMRPGFTARVMIPYTLAAALCAGALAAPGAKAPAKAAPVARKAPSKSVVITKPAPQRGAKPPAKKLEAYTETIPGTTVTFEMIPIPAGTVKVADPAKTGATREAKVGALWFGKTELAWDAYDVFAFRLDLPEGQSVGPDAVARPTKPYGAPDGGFGHRGYPAMNVTFHSASEFCRWLSVKTGKRYRLPTEAEWEYACRAGVLANGPIADTDLLGKMAWHWDNADEKTHPVAAKQANAWGLFDTLGNVAEWCDGLDRKPVVRGGSFNDNPDKVFPGARQPDSPDWQMSDPQNPKSRWWLTDGAFIGFRIVRVAP